MTSFATPRRGQSCAGWSFVLTLFEWRKWKYNPKLLQHYLEVNEDGKITSHYSEKTEEEETRMSETGVAFTGVSSEEPGARPESFGPISSSEKPTAEEEVQAGWFVAVACIVWHRQILQPS